MSPGILLAVIGVGLYLASSASGAKKPPATKPPATKPPKNTPGKVPPKDVPKDVPPDEEPPADVELRPVTRAVQLGDMGAVTIGSDELLRIMMNPDLGDLIEMTSSNPDVIESETYSASSPPVVIDQEPKGPGATSLTFRWYRQQSTGEIDSAHLSVTATATPRAVGVETE